MNFEKLQDLICTESENDCLSYLSQPGLLQLSKTDLWNLVNWAAFRGFEKVVMHFFSLGIGKIPPPEIEHTSTPLHEAIRFNHFSLAFIILTNPYPLKIRDDNNLTAFHLLANCRAMGSWNADAEALKNRMIELGCKASSVPEAAAFFDLTTVKRLVDEGKAPDDRLTYSERSAMHIGALYGDVPLLEYLLSLNPPMDENDSFRYVSQVVDINAGDLNGITPLDLASSESVVMLLKKHGCMTENELMDACTPDYDPLLLLEVLEKDSQKSKKHDPSQQLPYPGKKDWKTWQALSRWAKTAPINTYWIDFSLTISNKIKKGSKLTVKDQENMMKCWKQAVKNGFGGQCLI